MHTEYDTDCGYALLQLTRDNITGAMEETRFLGIALCTRGTARVTMNVNTYDLAPNSILIIPPNSMMQVTGASPDWEARLICITRMELLREAAQEFDVNPRDLLERGAEYMDVTIRCYLLGQALSEVLEEMCNENEQK